MYYHPLTLSDEVKARQSDLSKEMKTARSFKQASTNASELGARYLHRIGNFVSTFGLNEAERGQSDSLAPLVHGRWRLR